MESYEPIAGGYTAGHPERSLPPSGATTAVDLSALTDDELVKRARETYQRLQATPRWHNDNDRLITAWARVCAEVNTRGLTDLITFGEP